MADFGTPLLVDDVLRLSGIAQGYTNERMGRANALSGLTGLRSISGPSTGIDASLRALSPARDDEIIAQIHSKLLQETTIDSVGAEIPIRSQKQYEKRGRELYPEYWNLYAADLLKLFRQHKTGAIAEAKELRTVVKGASERQASTYFNNFRKAWDSLPKDKQTPAMFDRLNYQWSSKVAGDKAAEQEYVRLREMVFGTSAERAARTPAAIEKARVAAEQAALTLSKGLGEQEYRQGAPERKQVVTDAISNLTKGFPVRPGSDIRDPDPEKAYSQMIARLIALGTNTTDLNSARATFEAMNSLMTAEASGTMDENLSRIARDIVSKVAGGKLKPTEALSEFNDRTGSYTDKEKKAARDTITNFITVARQQVEDDRALETDVYTRDKRVLQLRKDRREDRLPAQKKATEDFVLDVLGEVTDAVLAGKLEYGNASDVLSDRLRGDSRGRGIYPDLKTIKSAQELLMKEIESKKPKTPTEERAWVRDINKLTELADITGKDSDQIYKDLSSLDSRIRSKIRETWMAEKAKGYAVRKEAEATGVRYARALRTILRGVPEKQRQEIWDYLKGTMSPPELIGFNEFESQIGANLWESRAPLPTNVKEPTPEPPRPGTIEAIAPERSEAEATAFELQILTNDDGKRLYDNDTVLRILFTHGLIDKDGNALR